MKTLKITCESADTLPFEQIDDFQGGLKTRTDEDYQHLIDSFIEHGFSFPFFVWAHDVYDPPNPKQTINSCIDGHGRLEALQRLQNQGYEIPPLPVVYIEFESEDDAKRALIYVNSVVGNYTEMGIQDFVLSLGDLTANAANIDMSRYHFAGIDMDSVQKKLEKIAVTEEFIKSVQPETPPAFSAPLPAEPLSPPMSAPELTKPLEGQKQAAEFAIEVKETPMPQPGEEVVVVCQHCQESFRYVVE
jgi:hypothetical protein